MTRWRSRSRNATLRQVLSVALSLAAVLGVLCALSVVASLAFGVRPLVVQSGSMSPAIETGALAWAREVPVTDLAVGDVVMVDKAEGGRVTHRIVGIEPSDRGVVLELQGDANAVPDAERYAVQTTHRVFADVPLAGRVVAWFSKPIGLFLLGMYAMGLLFVVLRPGDRGSGQHGPGQRGRRRGGRRASGEARSAAAGSAALLSVAALSAFGVVPTAAAFTDTAVVTGSTLATDYLRPVTISCTGGGILVSPTITWSQPNGPVPSSYLITYTRGATTGTATSATTSWTVPGSLAPPIIGSYTYTITVQSVRGDNWRSAGSNSTQVTMSRAVVGLGRTCGATAANPQTQAQPSCTRNANGSITLTWTNINANYEYYWERRNPGAATLASASAGFPNSGTLGASVAQGQPVALTLTSSANGTKNFDIVVFSQVEGTTSPRGAPTTNQVGRQGNSGLFCNYQ